MKFGQFVEEDLVLEDWENILKTWTLAHCMFTMSTSGIFPHLWHPTQGVRSTYDDIVHEYTEHKDICTA